MSILDLYNSCLLCTDNCQSFRSHISGAVLTCHRSASQISAVFASGMYRSYELWFDEGREPGDILL